MTVYAHSLDFDGCLSNSRFLYLSVVWDKHRSQVPFDDALFFADLKKEIDDHNQRVRGEEEQLDPDVILNLFVECWDVKTETLNMSALIIKANQTLFEQLAKEVPKGIQPVLFVGSNRQSYTTDLGNARNLIHDRFQGEKKYGSAFPYFRSLAHDLNFQLDDMLLADVYQEKAHGSTMRSAEACSYKSGEDSLAREHEWLFDETKLSILYAQMHKLANQYPNEAIVFNYVDDRDDILKPLKDYFNNYPEMIPKNVTLNIIKYNGQLGETHAIKGTGLIDKEYEKTVQDMARIALNGARGELHNFASLEEAKANSFNLEKLNFHQYYTENGKAQYQLHLAKQPLYEVLNLIEACGLGNQDKLMKQFVQEKKAAIRKLQSPEDCIKIQDELDELLKSLQRKEAQMVMQKAQSFKDQAGFLTIGMRRKGVLIETAMLNTPINERGTVISQPETNAVQEALAAHRHIGRLSRGDNNKARSFQELKQEVQKTKSGDKLSPSSDPPKHK